MDRELIKKDIVGMKKRITAVDKCLDELWSGFHSVERTNTLLDVVMQQVELCCIEMRNTCEKIRPSTPPIIAENSCVYNKEIYGEVTRMDNGWLDIRLNALLPHCKFVGGTQYVSSTITNLLNRFSDAGGEIPCFDKAYVAIVEHCNFNAAGAFDSDNKGFKGAINALKGRLFKDDNQFEMALGLFTVIDEETCCHIYVLPYEDASDFHYQFE